MFDLLTLNYIRTLIVENKTGMRNLRNPENDNEKDELSNTIKSNNKNKKQDKIKKMRKSSQAYDEQESSDESERNKIKNILTKEKVMELQVQNFLEIREFIFSLPIYSTEIALERFRPNGEKYSASKVTESLIKIKLSNFTKLLEDKYHLEQNIGGGAFGTVFLGENIFTKEKFAIKVEERNKARTTLEREALILYYLNFL